MLKGTMVKLLVNQFKSHLVRIFDQLIAIVVIEEIGLLIHVQQFCIIKFILIHDLNYN